MDNRAKFAPPAESGGLDGDLSIPDSSGTDVDGDRPFKCPGCPKRLSTYGALVSHERKHRNTSADDALFVPTTRTFSTGRGVLVEEHVPLVRVDSPLLPPLEGEDVVEDSDEESGG